MSTTFISNFGLLVVLGTMLATSPCGAQTNAAPQVFKATIGGFLGTTYSVELRGDTLVYSVADGPKKASPKEVTPTTKQWNQFRRSLDEIKVWQWRTNYPNPGAYDGTQWSVDIRYPDRALKAEGDNNYPDRAGKPGGLKVTKTFGLYTAAIRKLLGGLEFQ